MSTTKNFIQYVDDTYAVKTAPIEMNYISEYEQSFYVVPNIDNEFLLLALFVNNQRVTGVNIVNHDNLFSTAILNDVGLSDLNTFPKNHFFTPLSLVYLEIIVPDAVISPVENVNVLNFPVDTSEKFFPKFLEPQYRSNTHNFTSAVTHPTIVQATIYFSPSYTNIFSNAYYNGHSGEGIIIDSGGAIVIDKTKCFNIGSNYYKVVTTSSKLSAVANQMLRIYTNYRTNEIYLVSNNGNATGVFCQFDYATIQWVDGGFNITCPLTEMTVQVRNKFFL